MLLIGLPVGDPDPHRRLATISSHSGSQVPACWMRCRSRRWQPTSYAGTLTVAVNADATVADIRVLAAGIERALTPIVEDAISTTRPPRTFDSVGSAGHGGSSMAGCRPAPAPPVPVEADHEGT